LSDEAESTSVAQVGVLMTLATTGLGDKSQFGHFKTLDVHNSSWPLDTLRDFLNGREKYDVVGDSLGDQSTSPATRCGVDLQSYFHRQLLALR
jgi:hypothetical protein